METEKGLAASTTDCSFDCKSCLQLAKDPVVTLCGHLYCWPCMYNRLQSGSCHCSACNTLIPLYGQDGHSVKGVSEIPCRPSAHTPTALEKPNIQHPEAFRRTSSPPQPTTVDLLGGTVMTTIMSPRLLGSARDMYFSSDETVRRQEDFLQQLWAFLLLCALMCLLVF